jgi:putative ABC transport system permease protein
MLDRELWQEVFYILKKNKTRTFLTGFGVFWGIFMLVVTLGAGKGLSNSAYDGLGDLALNSLFIWTKPTTIPYGGFPRGRNWYFTNEDTQALIDNIPEIDVLSPSANAWGGERKVSRESRSDLFRINGSTPEYLKIEPQNIIAGRFVNDKDMTEKRKVIVIGTRVREILFEPDEEALGEYLKINGIYFKVVGILKSKRSPNNGGDRENKSIFMPFSTLQLTQNMGNFVGYYSVLPKPGVSVTPLENKMKAFLAKRHKVSPEDDLAFGTDNLEEIFSNVNDLFMGIFFLSWFVGVLTLLAGVIGTSNIMLVIVRERTKEIGIQRALGATPMKIIRQIVTESIFLNTVAGYIGLLLSAGLVELIGFFLARVQADTSYFKDPEVDLKVAVLALVILVVSGAVAGLLPAKRAVSIKPIDALRSEI